MADPAERVMNEARNTDEMALMAFCFDAWQWLGMGPHDPIAPAMPKSCNIAVTDVMVEAYGEDDDVDFYWKF